MRRTCEILLQLPVQFAAVIPSELLDSIEDVSGRDGLVVLLCCEIMAPVGESVSVKESFSKGPIRTRGRDGQRCEVVDKDGRTLDERERHLFLQLDIVWEL